MSRYLPFVRIAVETLLERQTARAGAKPDGALCLTVTHPVNRAWLSLGRWLGDRYELVQVPAAEIEMTPYRMDLQAWPVLDLLAERTGEDRWQDLSKGMAAVVAKHGFEPASGLLYPGSVAALDVVALQPVGVGPWSKDLLFKLDSAMPWEQIWQAAPSQMERCARSAYYGLITRPETMDFNRYCPFGFDDRLKKHVLAFHPGHVGFASAAATLVRCWATAYSHSRDPQFLAWTRAMVGKWNAVQHPDTGLLPHFFGRVDQADPEMSPRPYANIYDAGTAIDFLRAGRELARHPKASGLASQCCELGRRLLEGLLRYGYDPAERLFPCWIRLEGGEHTESAFYNFRTQEDKNRAVRLDPRVEAVDVFRGYGFYRSAPANVTTANWIPYYAAMGAELTGDTGLLERARFFLQEAVREGLSLSSEFNDLGQWTFPASAVYIRALLHLFHMTREEDCLRQARQLADREIVLLSGFLPDGTPDWWRLPGRDRLLEALLLLDS